MAAQLGRPSSAIQSRQGRIRVRPAPSAACAPHEAATVWHPVVPVSTVEPSRGAVAAVDGTRVGVYRAGLTLHAVEARCPHLDAPFGPDDLRHRRGGARLVCPWHFWEFDLR